MSEWPWVVLPALLTALVVRLDAKLIGPYFALSGLVAGAEGIWARHWYESGPLRSALWRRFAYPLVLGFGIAWTGMRGGDVLATGLLAGLLLVWPVIFHGLPWEVPRRTWHLPALYMVFLAAYGAFSYGGYRLKGLVVSLSDGDMRSWLLDQAVGSFGAWIVALLLVPAFRRLFTGIRDEAVRREAIGAEALIEESSWQEQRSDEP